MGYMFHIPYPCFAPHAHILGQFQARFILQLWREKTKQTRGCLAEIGADLGVSFSRWLMKIEGFVCYRPSIFTKRTLLDSGLMVDISIFTMENHHC